MQALLDLWEGQILTFPTEQTNNTSVCQKLQLKRKADAFSQPDRDVKKRGKAAFEPFKFFSSW